LPAKNTEEACHYFITQHTKLFDKHCPIKTKKIRAKALPKFLKDATINIKKLRDKYYSQYKLKLIHDYKLKTD